jgi:hypothetical protein
LTESHQSELDLPLADDIRINYTGPARMTLSVQPGRAARSRDVPLDAADRPIIFSGVLRFDQERVCETIIRHLEARGGHPAHAAGSSAQLAVPVLTRSLSSTVPAPCPTGTTGHIRNFYPTV